MGNPISPSLEAKLVGYRPTPESLARFRMWHVESLLNQAADLLDRCLRDRAQYHDLRFRWRNLEFEEKETEQAQALLDEQIKAGLLTLEIEKLTEEVVQKKTLSAIHDKVVYFLWERYKPVGNPEAHGHRANAFNAEISRSLNTLDAVLRGKQLSWEEVSKDFRQKAIDTAKVIRQQKSAEMKNSGAFDLKEQYRMLEESIIRDFMDAYDRLTVAYQGLQAFYAYDRLQQNPAPPLLNPAADRFGPIDALVLWTREAIRWLVAFGQLDQGWTCSLSIRALVGESEWNGALGHGQARAKLEFMLAKETFDSHTFVRMRGISMFAISEGNLSLPLSASAKAPKRAISHQIWAVGSSTYTQIDQSSLPYCHLGRVETRSSPRTPEVVGLISLMNASPISDTDFTDDGKWSIEVSNNLGASLDGLKDIHLELILTGRPK